MVPRILVVKLVEVRLLRACSLLVHPLDSRGMGGDLPVEVVLEQATCLGVGVHFVSNRLDVVLEVRAGLFALGKHGLVLLQILLLVDVCGHFDVEAHKQVFEVFLVGLAALEVEVEVSIFALLHHHV